MLAARASPLSQWYPFSSHNHLRFQDSPAFWTPTPGAQDDLNPPLPEGKGIPGSGCLLEQRSRRSSAISASRVETSPDEHDVCGVLVPWGHVSAYGAGVGALTQRQAMLGSRIAVRAVHRGVRGVDEADVPPVLAAHLDQRGLGGADGGVSGLAGHGGLGEELRTEVLDSDGIVVADSLLAHLRPMS